MFKRAILMCAFGLMLLLATTVMAQTSGGQFCVRAFEDRDGSGTRDTGEPLLTRGVSAELLNAQGIVIQTQMMEDSPTAAQGVICFLGLAAGDYTINVISADYTATTTTTNGAAIADSELPTVFEFGGRSVQIDSATAPTVGRGLSEETRALLERVIIALLGALVAMAFMALLGVLIYFLILRGRWRRAAAARVSSTGQIRPVTRDDMLAVYGPPPTKEDTGEIR
jgi:hypothetical protein